MNEKAIFEIGDIIRVRYSFTGKKLTAKELTECYEYKYFKKEHPELCLLAESDELDKVLSNIGIEYIHVTELCDRCISKHKKKLKNE